MKFTVAVYTINDVPESKAFFIILTPRLDNNQVSMMG